MPLDPPGGRRTGGSRGLPGRRSVAGRYDVTALGELVIDLVPTATPWGPAYLPKPGGAPANVAAGVARLGLRSAMIGKVGTEPFGQSAAAALAAAGVAVHSLVRTAAHNTALAVVAPTESGASDFFFYRENCADSNLCVEDVPDDLIEASRVLHLGSLMLAAPRSAEAQRQAVRSARSHGVLVSVDPNLRPALWRDAEGMRAAALEAVAAADIVKVSEEELAFLVGHSLPVDGVRALWRPDLLAMAVTKGPAGAEIFTAHDKVSVPGYVVETADAVGCGDAFAASLLAGLLEEHPQHLKGDRLRTIARRCCAAGAIVATRSGALESMPTRAEIDAFLRNAA